MAEGEREEAKTNGKEEETEKRKMERWEKSGQEDSIGLAKSTEPWVKSLQERCNEVSPGQGRRYDPRNGVSFLILQVGAGGQYFST
jgi:hypothetical protein